MYHRVRDCIIFFLYPFQCRRRAIRAKIKTWLNKQNHKNNNLNEAKVWVNTLSTTRCLCILRIFRWIKNNSDSLFICFFLAIERNSLCSHLNEKKRKIGHVIPFILVVRNDSRRILISLAVKEMWNIYFDVLLVIFTFIKLNKKININIVDDSWILSTRGARTSVSHIFFDHILWLVTPWTLVIVYIRIFYSLFACEWKSMKNIQNAEFKHNFFFLETILKWAWQSQKHIFMFIFLLVTILCISSRKIWW